MAKLKDYEFHPIAEEFPINEGDIDEIARSMEEHGFDKTKKIALYEGKIIDGRCRYLASKKAKVQALFEGIPKSIDPHEFSERANLHRRHLTSKQQQEKREQRLERISKALGNGESKRNIAKNEGISRPQVDRDVEEIENRNSEHENPCTPVPPQKESANRQTNKDKKICERCKRMQRTEPNPKCQSCLDLKKKPKPDLVEVEPEPEEPSIDERIKLKNSELEKWCRDLMAFAETMPDDPWLQDLNRRDGAIQKLKNCCETIRSAKCHCACPKCDGSGCAKCHDTGRVTKYAFDQMSTK